MPKSDAPSACPTTDAIEVRDSQVHGLGAFAARALPRGATIGVYAGRRHAAQEVETRDWNHALTYAFGLSDGSVIDASDGGNATRHLNHSCKPNCVAYEVGEGEGAQIVIEAKRRLRVGEELFLDYQLDVGDDRSASDYPCHCGAPRCRGTLVAKA